MESIIQAKYPRLENDVQISKAQKLERQFVWSLLVLLDKNGFKAVNVFDGEGAAKVASPEEAFVEVYALDEACVRFKDAAGNRYRAAFALGNEPDCVCYDYSWFEGSLWNGLMEKWQAAASARAGV